MKDRLLFSIVSLSIGVTAMIYASFPADIIQKYNLNAITEPLGDSPILLFLSILPLLIISLFNLLPNIEVKPSSQSKFRSATSISTITITIFLLVLNSLIVLGALGFILNLINVIILTMSTVILLIGLYFFKRRKTYLMGIKTTWTLESEEVWLKTHVLAGKCYILIGFFGYYILTLPQALRLIVFVSSFLALHAFTILISYLFFKQIQRKGDD